MIDTLLEALGLSAIFRGYDDRPTWRRPRRSLRILGILLWIALLTALLLCADLLNNAAMEMFTLGR